jgi:hypothetical protein
LRTKYLSKTDRMSAIEKLEPPFIHSQEETPPNCPHELIREGDYVVIVMLTDLNDMAAPCSVMCPLPSMYSPPIEVD